MDLKEIASYCATQANSFYIGFNSVVSRYILELNNEINRLEVRNLINTGHPVGAGIAIISGFVIYNREKIKEMLKPASARKGRNLEQRAED